MLHTKSSTRNVHNCIYLGNKQVSFNSDHICVNSFQIAFNYLVSEVTTLLLKRTSGIDVCYFYIYFFVLSVMFVCRPDVEFIHCMHISSVNTKYCRTKQKLN